MFLFLSCSLLSPHSLPLFLESMEKNPQSLGKNLKNNKINLIYSLIVNITLSKLEQILRFTVLV